MASVIGSSSSLSQAQTLSACHTVLTSKDLAKTIFSYLLADQKAATRNLRMAEEQEKVVVYTRGSGIGTKLENDGKDLRKLGKKEKKELIDARELTEGTRTMEVARSVCREWNNIILRDKEFHFFLIFTRAKRIFTEYVKENGGLSDANARSRVCQIARLESLWDPACAISTLKWISDGEDVDGELVQIVRKAVSMNNLANAKTMAHAIKKIEQKIKALCEIAKIDPQVLQEAKDLVSQFNEQRDSILRDSMLLEIAKVEALYDLAIAEATINKVNVRNWGKPKMYVELAKVAAQYALEAVKTWAGKIEDAKTQALVQFEIAIIERDPISASKWVADIEPTVNSKNAELAQAYINIARLDRSLAHARAKEYISSFSPGREKFKLLIEIAELDENPNFAEAKQEATLAQFSSLPDDGNFINAIKSLELGSDYQYVDIALAEAKYNVEAARATADKIVDPARKVTTKYEIEMVGKNFDAAKVAASQISNPLQQAFAFINIARKDPLHDLAEAKASAYRIKGVWGHISRDVFEKVGVICSIAEVVQEFPIVSNEPKGFK